MVKIRCGKIDEVKIRGKIRTLQLSNAFLKKCIAKRVSPRYVSSRIKNSQARPSPTMERAFINDEIGKNREKIGQVAPET